MDKLSYLAELKSRLQAISEDISTSFGKLSENELNRKPSEISWSVAQCLEHLIVSDNLYFDRIKKAIQKAKEKGSPPDNSFKSGWFGKRFINSMKPGINKYKVPGVFKPSASNLQKKILSDFEAHEQELLQLIDEASDADLNRVKITSPVNSLIRFRLGDALNVLVTHQERHLLQAKKVMEYFSNPLNT